MARVSPRSVDRIPGGARGEAMSSVLCVRLLGGWRMGLGVRGSAEAGDRELLFKMRPRDHEHLHHLGAC